MISDPDAPSYYRASAHEFPDHPPLDGDFDVDVCVIGAGFTGLSAALDLAQAGYSVAILEARTVGFGASGRNGGQICTGFSPGMGKAEKRLSDADAKIAWDVVDGAISLVQERVDTHKIDCDLKWGYLHVATKDRHNSELAEHRDEFAKYGYEGLTLLDKAGVEERLGSEVYKGGLWEPKGGHIHPLNYCIGLARAATEAGAKLYENSAALQIETGANPSATTAKGKVNAKFMVLAGNAYLQDAVPYLYRRLMPVQSYILATEPLGENFAKSLIRDDDAICDSNFIVNYYRLSGDKRMLFGGRASYSTLQPRDLFKFMKPRMLEVYPQLNEAKLDYCWGGYIGITVDRMPHLGRIGTSTLYAQGFSGQGVALSGICGRLMANAIRGQAEQFDVMSKFQPPVFPGGKLRTPALVLAMLYYRLQDMMP